MAAASPRVVVLAGPNGAGKSTVAPKLLRGALEVEEVVNADVIASGLSSLPESVAFTAGRIMLKRIRKLAEAKRDFAFETTLASRTFAPWIKRWQSEGYEAKLVFLWIPSSSLSIRRVEHRVRSGGHDIPSEVIRRRHRRGLRNLRELYLPLVDRWYVYDNLDIEGPTRVATGRHAQPDEILEPEIWRHFQEALKDA